MDTLILPILTLTAVACLVLLLTEPRRVRIGLPGSYRRDDAADQLRHVMAASFHKKKVMSRAEYRVFRMVEAEILARRNGCRVLSQTSLGEILGSDDNKAFFAINSKRVDVLIISPSGEPLAAIEYQGGGHHQGNAAARDAIKREALRKAGVHFIEVLEGHSDGDVISQVRKLFPLPQAA